MLNAVLYLFLGTASAQAGPPEEIDMPAMAVVESSARRTPEVPEPTSDAWAPQAACSGGVTSPAIEAALMEALLTGWPHITSPVVRGEWRAASSGNRVCIRHPADGAVLCFEPRGSEFLEVYAGANTCSSREEALRTLAEALNITIVPRRRIVLPAE